MIKKLLLVSLGVAVLGLCPAISSAADLSKEGTFATTYTGALPPGSAKDWETLGKGTAGIFEGYLVVLNDAGEGFFHKTTGHCIGFGSDTAKKGADRNNGECIYMDSDGDKFVTQFVQERPDEKSPMKTKNIILGGTGKYEGIQGNYEFVGEFLKSSVDNGYYFLSHAKGSYKITR